MAGRVGTGSASAEGAHPSRVVRIIGTWLLGSFFLFLALLTALGPYDDPGDRFFTLATGLFAAACAMMGIWALKMRRSPAELWIRGTEASREALAIGGIFAVAVPVLVAAEAQGDDVLGPIVGGSLSFLSIGVWVLFAGHDLHRRLDAQGRAAAYPNEPGTSRRAVIASPRAMLLAILVLVLADAVALWIFIAGADIDGLEAIAGVQPSAQGAATAAGLLVFGVAMLIHTAMLRGAPADLFLRVGALIRQYVVLNGIVAVAIAYLLLADPTQQDALNPVIFLATGLLVGTLVIAYAGPFLTEFAAARVELRAAQAGTSRSTT